MNCNAVAWIAFTMPYARSIRMNWKRVAAKWRPACIIAFSLVHFTLRWSDTTMRYVERYTSSSSSSSSLAIMRPKTPASTSGEHKMPLEYISVAHFAWLRQAYGVHRYFHAQYVGRGRRRRRRWVLFCGNVFYCLATVEWIYLYGFDICVCSPVVCWTPSQHETNEYCAYAIMTTITIGS